ncbi:MAG: hypothetical protein DSZ31_01605 [Gammaproteobacteria bacterium]|nr:MAG: hypothetical protein DSZ31_01605 [Gammaproteobacteria bacterium]
MKAVILSAGRGKRLRPFTDCLPKPLLPINSEGKRVIDGVLDYLLPKCEEIFVVVGYKGELIRKHLGGYDKVKVLSISEEEIYSGNLYTLLRAKRFLKETDFVITNADHIFPQDVWNYFPRREKPIEITFHSKSFRKILEDEMKVKLNNGNFERMDKALKDYDGAYIGITFVEKGISEEFWKTAEEIFKTKGGTAKVEDVLNQLKEFVGIVNVDPVKFYEIDTFDDLVEVWNAHKIGGI